MDPEERNDESFIFLVETAAGVPSRVRLFPTAIDGFQARLAGRSSRRIAGRMQRLSAGLGTPSRWDEDAGTLEILVDG